MKFNRILLSATLIVVALVVQVSVLARLQLPGAVPDLVLLTVVALALAYGPVSGSLIGFTAGLLADLAPPADHAMRPLRPRALRHRLPGRSRQARER